jgi:hypothetical protein
MAWSFEPDAVNTRDAWERLLLTDMPVLAMLYPSTAPVDLGDPLGLPPMKATAECSRAKRCWPRSRHERAEPYRCRMFNHRPDKAGGYWRTWLPRRLACTWRSPTWTRKVWTPTRIAHAVIHWNLSSNPR